MRTLVEVFKVMKNNKHLFKEGLCLFTSYLINHDIISNDEYHLMSDYIDNHRPLESSKYYGLSETDSPWYWEPGKWHPRVLLINAQIKLLNKNNHEKNM